LLGVSVIQLREAGAAWSARRVPVLDGLLDTARNGRSAVLVVRGEAGVGKTALHEYAIRSASDLRVLLTFGVHVNYLTEVLPGILLFSLGLSITVAPLTAAILAWIDQAEAGIGSAVNNAVARVAGLIATVRDRRNRGRAVQLIARSPSLRPTAHPTRA
jgi:hypothetical protein